MNKSSKELLIKAVEINPEDVTAHGNLGNMYFNEERYEDAIETYEKAIQINPEEIATYCNLGDAYSEKERYEEAIETYEKAIQINPEQVAAYNNLINAYNRTLQNQVKKKPFGFFRKLFNILRK